MLSHIWTLSLSLTNAKNGENYLPHLPRPQRPTWEHRDAQWWIVQASVFLRPLAPPVYHPWGLYIRHRPRLRCCWCPCRAHPNPTDAPGGEQRLRCCHSPPEPPSSVARAASVSRSGLFPEPSESATYGVSPFRFTGLLPGFLKTPPVTQP